ncbi:MAG TPA: hypothetical protein DCR17_00590 [Verrucomicrobiales bacterium]|nr:hypothetical protein [Verrucomicrobiales bacterium]
MLIEVSSFQLIVFGGMRQLQFRPGNVIHWKSKAVGKGAFRAWNCYERGKSNWKVSLPIRSKKADYCGLRPTKVKLIIHQRLTSWIRLLGHTALVFGG